MLAAKKNKINYEILSFAGKVELIIRGEETINEKAIIIIGKSLEELEKIISKIEDFNYSEVISYLKENAIAYNEGKFF